MIGIINALAMLAILCVRLVIVSVRLLASMVRLMRAASGRRKVRRYAR